MADITEKIGAEEILLDPTKQYSKCGEVVNALTADDLKIQYNNEWIPLTKFIALLHMGIKDLIVTEKADTISIRWTGSNDVLIYIDSNEGVRPSQTNQHIAVVGKGKHHILVKEVDAKYGLEADIEVTGTTISTPIQVKVSDVTTTSFTVEALNYDANQYYYSIKSGTKTLATTKAVTFSNLNPNTTYLLNFYDLNGDNIGTYSVQTDTAGYEVQPPAVKSNQVFTFKENAEIGVKLFKLDFDTRGLPLLTAHFDTDNKLIDYIAITADGWLYLKKKPSIDTLPKEWTNIDNDHKSEDGRVVIQTSAGGGANYVQAIIERVSPQAPDIPYSQTFDMQENEVHAVGEVIGHINIIDNGSPITKVEVTGAPDKYVYIDKNGDIISTSVPMDFELLADDPAWDNITPTGVGSARKEAPLTVTAYNANGSVTRIVRIRCVNMPDTAPTIDTTVPLEITIAENTAPNTFITKLPVSDDMTAITNASVSSGLTSFIKVDNAGNVLSNAPADFEALKDDANWKAVDDKTITHLGTVSFTNANGTSTAPLRLTITDVADSKPLVSDIAINIIENTPVNSIAGKISVVSDSAPIQGITIDAPLVDWITVDDDGTIRLKQSPDFENMPAPFTLIDGRMTAQSDVYFTNMFGTSKAVVLFQVANVADSDPVIPVHQTFTVKEGVQEGTYVGHLTYSLGDHTLDTITLDAPASEYFQIDKFGNVLLKATPDFENLKVEWAKDPLLQKASVNSKVTLSVDNGNLSVSELAAFTIENIADDKPIIQPDQTFSVVENAPAGKVMGTLVFNSMGNDIQSASFDVGASKYFNIDNNGVITATQPLDWEALDPAEFTTDGQDKYLMSNVAMTNVIGTSVTPIRLQVSNILDDKPTILTKPTAYVNQFENFPIGQVIGHIDISDNGSPLTNIEILDAEINGLISISTDGDVTFKVSPDYEALSTDWTEVAGNPSTKTKTSIVRVYNKYGYDETSLSLTVKDIVELAKPNVLIDQRSYSNPNNDKFGPIGLEAVTNNVLLIPVDEGNSPVVNVTIDNPDANGYLLANTVLDGSGKRFIEIHLVKEPDFQYTGTIPSGWALHPTRALIRRQVLLSVTNGVGTTTIPVDVEIAGTPATRSDIDNALNANVLTGLENTRKITDMSGLFMDTTRNIPNVSKYDMRNVTTIANIFANVTPAEPIHNWELLSVLSMARAFYNSQYNFPIDDWLIQSQNTIDVREMFRLSSFNSPILSFSNVKISSAYAMFAQNGAFNQPLPATMDFSNCFMFDEMFYYATAFNQDISSIVVPVAPPWNKSNTNFHTGSALVQANVHPALW